MKENNLTVFQIISGVVLTAMIIGGSLYWFADTKIDTLNQEIAALKEQISRQQWILTDGLNQNDGKSMNGNTKILLEKFPIAFELPQQYIVFQKEGFEGGYGTTVSIGKEIRPGHLKYVPLQIDFLLSGYDIEHQRNYKPSEYIPVVYKNEKERYGAPEYTQLFDNKAVRYTEDADGSTSIVGYIRANQLPKMPDEYLVHITSSTYGKGVEFDKHLFDTVVNTLRVVR